jgi:RND family efflux transporter MFP subunit
MCRRRRFQTTIRSVLIALAAALAACNEPPSPPDREFGKAIAEPVIPVTTAHVRRGEISQPISAPGSLMARRTSQIGAEVRGRIARVLVSEGDRVEEGAPLFEVDRLTYEMAVREAEGGLDVTQAERRQLEAELVRAIALGKKDVVAKQEIERLTTRLEVARALERRANEALAMARHNLEQTVVRAPFAGSVAARLADEGSTALITPQTIVVVMQETSHLEARAAIPESQMVSVHLGDRALLHIEGIAEPIVAVVGAVSDTIDAATRTYLVKIPVDNADHRLKAGVFTHVEIVPAGKQDALLVPRDAIRTEEARSRVLLVRDGRVEAVPVEVGMVSEDDAEILAGVAEGDEVVTGDAARTIAPGLRVRVVSAEKRNEAG